MKCSVKWIYHVTVAVQKSDREEIRWTDLPAYEFEGIIPFQALPLQGMRILMPENGPDEGMVDDVYLDVNNDGRFGYRIIMGSCLNVVGASLDEVITLLEEIVSRETRMLEKCGLSCGNLNLDRSHFVALVVGRVKP